VDELTDGGRGLQAGRHRRFRPDGRKPASLPELNASDSKWLIVVDRVENMSQTQRGGWICSVDRVGVNLKPLRPRPHPTAVAQSRAARRAIA
jgi:hypothetical protein